MWLAGRRRFLDLVFVTERVVVEFDGRVAHGWEQFDDDRYRQNELVRDGWTVIRLTWAMLDDPAYVRALVIGALRVARSKPRRRFAQAGGSRVR